MIPTTQTVRDNFMASHHQVMRITMGNTVITDANIIVGGFIIDSYSVSGERIEIGSAIASELTLKLANFSGNFSAVDFEGQEMFVELGVADWDAGETPVYIPMGYFTCDEQPKNRSVIEVKALDRMTKFDVPVDWTLFTFPCTLQSMVTAVCTEVGVTLGTTFSSLPNASYVIDYSPETSVTYRDIIRWAAFLTGTCARIDENGYLKFVWYTSSGITIDPSNRYSHQLEETDISITGVYYNGSGVEYLAGTADYALEFYDCHILQNNIETAVGNILTAVSGFTYRPFEAVVQSVPFLQPMDTITFEDKDGNDHTCIITHITYTGNQSTPIKGAGETPKEVSYASLSGLTAQQSVAIDDARKHATNYLSADSTGIMVANMVNGKRYVPSDVPTGIKNTFIDNDSFDVRDGMTSLASFGLESRIGSPENTHMKLYGDGLGVFDSDGTRQFLLGSVSAASSTVDTDISYTQEEEETSDISLSVFLDIRFPIILYDYDTTESLTFTYGTPVDNATLGSNPVSYDGGYHIYITHRQLEINLSYYAYEPQTTFGLTVGTRSVITPGVGNHSMSIGFENVATGNNSAVIGKYLDVYEDEQVAVGRNNSTDPRYLFEVGTGSDINHLKTGFAVTVDDDAELYLDTTASTGTTDGDLYAAIVALGWQNEVIV